MVSDKEIRDSNALLNDATAPRVAVFAGGTAGIGQLTVRALVGTGASVRIYLIGRKSSEERTHGFIEELKAINPKADVVWVEGEIALLAETERICGVIKSRESRIDLLFLTAGYAPFGPRRETAEGIETVQSLGYYGRILFIHHLLPLLSRAEAPKVVSVGGGGLESKNINLDDLEMRQPTRFRFAKVQAALLTLNTMAMDKLASDNPSVTFIHAWPGWVNTGNVWRGVEPGSAILSWFVRYFLEPLISFFAIKDETAGQRYLFLSTSSAYGGRGVPWTGKQGINSLNQQADGLFLVNYTCDCTPNAKVIPVLRERAQEKIWDHTQEILQPYM